MNTPEHDPTQHFISIKDEFLADKIVQCHCGWESKGYIYHPRAVMAGERHLKEQTS